MKLSKKLTEWQSKQLLDAATADKIRQYEEQNSKPMMLWALGGLGAFTIIIGLISVIAANWMHTPDSVKLGIDLLLCLILAIALYRAVTVSNATPKQLWQREVLVVIYYGFTLASMALIGQTYQLGGSVAKLLLVWTIATIPLVLLGRGKFLAILWLLGCASTYYYNLGALHDFVRKLTGTTILLEMVVASLALLGPLFFMYISRIPALLRARPVIASEFSKFSWLAIIALGWMCQFLWYDSSGNGYDEGVIYLISICFIATAISAYLIPRWYPAATADTQLAMRVILVSVFVLGVTAIWHQQSLALVGALTNVGYMLVLAWAALKFRSIALFNAVTALICLRILFIYFEVFGSMLQTGIGLVVGGVLTLLIARWWFKKSDDLAARFGLEKEKEQ